MILLSTDVNATIANRPGSRMGAFLRTHWQRWRKDRLVDNAILAEIARAGVPVGWSIGGTHLGRYYDPVKRILYVECSFGVEILDASYPLLKAIAEALRQVFGQEEVILKSYDTGVAEHIRDL
jgi:hypothetical protein